MKKKIILLISGKGTNAINIINYFQNSNSIEVSLVLSNNKSSPIFQNIKKYNLTAEFFNLNDFDDAIDFIGWYNDQSSRRSKISKSDAYNLYLAYHEGQGGFNRKTYRSKKWLIKVARKVQGQSKKYQSQLSGCEKSLKKKRGIFGLFG